MKFGNKLKTIRKENNLSMEELKNILNHKYDLNISKSMISRWENNKSEPFNTYLLAYAKEFNLDMNDLLNIEPNDLSNIPGIIPVKAIKKIPILGSIVCGYPVWSAENYQGYYPSDPDIFAADFCLYADGDSMVDADIHDGDLVFFKKTPDAENGTIVAALIDGDATLKKFTKTNEAIILSPCNDTYQPIIINKDDGKEVRILGEMIAVLSKRNK